MIYLSMNKAIYIIKRDADRRINLLLLEKLQPRHRAFKVQS
jgi:hypothetical protein